MNFKEELKKIISDKKKKEEDYILDSYKSLMVEAAQEGLKEIQLTVPISEIDVLENFCEENEISIEIVTEETPWNICQNYYLVKWE